MEHVTDPRHFEKAVLRQILMTMARTGKIPSLNKTTEAEFNAIVLLVNSDLLTVVEGLTAAKRMIERIGG